MTTTHDVGARSQKIQALIDEVYSRETVMGKSGEPRDIFPAGLRRADGQRLYEAVLEEGATRTIETGFALGLSGLFICKALLENDASKAHHVAADPYQKKNYDDAGLLLFEEAGLSSMLELHVQESGLLLPQLAAEGRTFELGFVDGGHLFETVLLDLAYMARLIEPGGLIIVDDMWMPAVRLAVDYCVENLEMVHLNRVPQDDLQRRMQSILGREAAGPVQSPQEPVAYLRMPAEPLTRNWDHFQPFGYEY